MGAEAADLDALESPRRYSLKSLRIYSLITLPLRQICFARKLAHQPGSTPYFILTHCSYAKALLAGARHAAD